MNAFTQWGDALITMCLDTFTGTYVMDGKYEKSNVFYLKITKLETKQFIPLEFLIQELSIIFT